MPDCDPAELASEILGIDEDAARTLIHIACLAATPLPDPTLQAAAAALCGCNAKKLTKSTAKALLSLLDKEKPKQRARRRARKKKPAKTAKGDGKKKQTEKTVRKRAARRGG